jgi:hypothetical protein
LNPACRLCAAPLTRTFVDLGMSPPCESLRPDQRDDPETTYSLHVRICERCLLVPLPAHVPAEEIFTADYAYFSSYSDSWVAHAGRFVEDMAARLDLGAGSFVVEAASNDGHLLQHAVARWIRVLGWNLRAEIAQQLAYTREWGARLVVPIPRLEFVR